MPSTYYLAPDDWVNITFRLCLALLIGAIIGIERQLQRKPAGLRTHMLVALGAALFMLVPLQASGEQPSADALSRVIQGVAAGVGFLGAGEILRESTKEAREHKIRGLTSAAAIWVSAALGIAAGCGLWRLGLIGAVMTWLVLKGVKELEARDRSRRE